MATFKYYHHTQELKFVTALPNNEFASLFPGEKGLRYDGYSKWVGRVGPTDPLLPVQRKIEYKRNPSKHKCNARCLGAKPQGSCECECGGKNHGLGMFTSLVESKNLSLETF
jgi:hypothetical protein